MSLTKKQQQQTIDEFQTNLQLLNYSLDKIASDLQTTTEKITAVAQLQVQKIEEPWILRNYLIDELRKNRQTPVLFSALSGDFHNYWFLNTEIIEKGKL